MEKERNQYKKINSAVKKCLLPTSVVVEMGMMRTKQIQNTFGGFWSNMASPVLPFLLVSLQPPRRKRGICHEGNSNKSVPKMRGHVCSMKQRGLMWWNTVTDMAS